VKRVIWSASAQRDILDVADYHDTIDPALADEIVLQLERAVLPLEDFPHLGMLLSNRPNVRKWTVAGTPFELLYVVTADVVEVRRVVHAASDWKR
jgi:plasmid stabilization system protein ParE